VGRLLEQTRVKTAFRIPDLTRREKFREARRARCGDGAFNRNLIRAENKKGAQWGEISHEQ